jgi:hypothetical protein
MRSPQNPGRASLAAGLLVLVFSPLLVGGHLHVDDHDGARHHIEAPHGDHEVALSELVDGLPSTQVKLVVSMPALATSATLAPESTVRRSGFGSGSDPVPARAPPRTTRSRAPPLFLS